MTITMGGWLQADCTSFAGSQLFINKRSNARIANRQKTLDVLGIIGDNGFAQTKCVHGVHRGKQRAAIRL